MTTEIFYIKMFKITSNYLTKTNSSYSAHLTRVDVGNTNFAPLATIGFGKQETTVLANTYGTDLDVPETWSDVATVVANGQLLTLAIDPQDPQPNEYIFNPYTKKITVYSYSRSIVISGSLQTVEFAPKQVTGLPSLFSLLPLEGQISFGRSFENHPTGQFSFETHYSKDQVHSVFAPGRELELFNIGYRVNNVSVSELPRSIYPDGRCKVSVSFGGKWENRLSQPCFLRSDGTNTIPGNEPFTDPECLTGQSGDPNNSIAMNTLLSRIGVPLSGSQLKAVPVPVGTLRDQVVSPDQLLQERLRVANSFVRYSDAFAVEVVGVSASTGHTILESEILEPVESSYEAISKLSKVALTPSSFNPQPPSLTNFPSTVTNPSPILTGETIKNLGFEYPCVELTGRFSEPKEKKENTQGNAPRYVRKPPNRTTRIEGNVTANEVPAGVTSIKVMSLCFDLGGETQTRTYVTEEYGAVVETVEEIWGFAFTSEDIYNKTTGQYGANPVSFWRLLKRITTQYVYDSFGDSGTGLLISKIGSGFNTVRWKAENAERPEVKDLDTTDAEDTKTRELFTFFRIPVIERYSRKLKLQPESSTEDAYELVKSCNRDGTASYKPVFNPNYLPPYYIEEERTEKISFKSRSNPLNDGKTIQAGDIFEPDLYVGNVEIYESKITGITPAKYEQKLIGFENRYPVYKRGALIEPQKWYRYNFKFSASGTAISTAIEDISTENGTGDLPTAGERIIKFTKEDPDTSQEDKKESIDALYKHLIFTTGYSQESPINGSESFPVAETFEEALAAARAKATIENWRNGYSENLTINFRPEIKEGDRVFYFCNGQYRQRIAISVNHELNILGNVNGQPIVTGQTKLTLGNYVMLSVNHAKIKLPATTDNKNNVTVTLKPVNEELFGVMDWANIRSRRNP
jgi:hypothetical protein